jgi:VanZ family protein
MTAPSRLPFAARLLILLVCLGVLAWLSLAPTDDLPKVNLWDKFEHACAYAVLTIVAAVLFPRRLAPVVIGCMVFGVSIEVFQAIMGFGRDGDWRDAVANASGAFVIVGSILLYRRLSRASA